MFAQRYFSQAIDGFLLSEDMTVEENRNAPRDAFAALKTAGRCLMFYQMCN
jgi:hypothetical protein